MSGHLPDNGDISDSLQHIEQEFELFMQNLPGLAWIKDGQGRYRYVNEKAEKAFCMPRHLLYGKSDDEIFTAETAAQFKEHDRQARERGTGVLTIETLMHDDGVLHHSIVSKFPLSGPGSFVGGMAIDITTQKQVEEALRLRVMELTLINTIGTICSEAQTEDEVLFGSTAAIAETLYPDNCGFLLLDSSRGVLVTHPSFVLSDPQVSKVDKPLGTGITGQVAQTGIARRIGDVSLEPAYLAADSRSRSELCLPMKIGTTVVGVLNIESDKPNAFTEADEQLMNTAVGLVANALKRLRAEKALRESEAFLQMSQKTGKVGSWQWDLSTNRVRWSEAVYAIYGVGPESFDGTLEGAVQMTHPEDLPAMQLGVQRILDSGKDQPLEYRVIRPDGEIRYLWGLGSVIRDAAGHPTQMLGTVVDITYRKQAEDERRQLDSQLQHAQKLDSLGVLAGGVAHDFNNLLTSMLGYASLALMQLPRESPARSMLHEIEQAAERAADLTQQMLAYSGKGKFVIQPVRLDSLVQEMEKLLQIVVSKKATVHLELEPATLDGDATQIRQVIMNLLLNASDALEEKAGEITVRTGVQFATSSDLRSTFVPDELPAGIYAFVEVEDNGCGMDDNVVQRIFEPFFTTKFTGRGLGLAAVQGIVRSHKGVIKVHSEPAKGTVFRVLIPGSTAIANAGKDVRRDSTLPRGRGTVLVVDDEPTVRLFSQRVLEAAGFKVHTANDGRHGSDVLRNFVEDIDIVLLDLTMPHMDGIEALALFRALNRDTPILVMSGYNDPEAISRSIDGGAKGFIQKPFDPRELVARLTQLLG